MGRLLQAKCSNCDYTSGLLRVDTGRVTLNTYFGVPALCTQERAVVVVNLKAPHQDAGEAPAEADDASPLAHSISQTIDAVRRELREHMPWSHEHEAAAEPEQPQPHAHQKPQHAAQPPSQHQQDEELTAHAEWPAEHGGDPGPALPTGVAEDDEPGEWFPADHGADPGIGGWGHSPQTGEPYGSQPKAKRPKLRGIAGHEPAASHAESTHAVPAEAHSSSGLVATPVEPRKTMPQGVAPAHAASHTAHVPAAAQLNLDPTVAGAAYPCPNDGAATTLYQDQAADLSQPQQCPRCGEQTLIFIIEGRWD